VVAHPELLQPRREYRPEWEGRLFELARVEAYLVSQGSWLRPCYCTLGKENPMGYKGQR
jgi:hypothetical protein